MAVAKSAAKILGIQTAEQLTNCFNSNACLPGDQFKMFWTALEGDPKEATTYMFEILKKLLEDTSSQNPILVEALVVAAHFGLVYMPFSSSDGRIPRFIKKYQSEEDKAAFIKHCPSAKDVMRILALSQEKQDVIGPNMIACSTMHSAEEFHVLHDITKFPTLDHTASIRAASLCFHYHHLRQIAGEEDKRIAIIQNIASKLQTLPQQMRMKPLLAKTSLLSLLFVLKQILALNSLHDKDLLKKVVVIVQQFYLWPQPYGAVARNVLQSLHRELVLPGLNLMEAITGEAFTVEHPSAPLIDNTRSRALHYLCSSDSPFAQQFARVLELRLPTPQERQRRGSLSNKSNKKVTSNQFSPPLQALIVLKLLADDGMAGPQELTQIQKLNESQVATLHGMVEAMVKELCTLSSPEQATETRLKTVSKIKAELAKLSNGGGGGGKLVSLPTSTQPPFLPKLPPLAHLANDSKSSYSIDTKEVIKMMCLDYMTYPQTGVFDELDSIFAGYSNAPKPCELRLIVAGDDAFTHGFLCAYMRILQSSPQWVSGIAVKLYLLPWGVNHIASWLARHDSWYNRHIYAPFRSPLFLVPWVSPSTPNEGFLPTLVDGGRESMSTNHKADGNAAGKEQEPAGCNRPGLFFRDSVAMYVREAQHSAELTVYQMEGWLDEIRGESQGGGKNEKERKLESLPDHKIPFLQRLEIGQAAEAEAYRVKRKLPEDTPLEDLLARKELAISTTPDVDVSFTKVDPSGAYIRTVNDEGIGFTSLLLSNVPRLGDPCFPSNPLEPWLELFVSALAGKTGGKRSVLLTDPKQHVSSLELSCNSPTAKFTVLLDGQVFGPYHHIRVTPARSNLVDLPVPTTTAVPQTPHGVFIPPQTPHGNPPPATTLSPAASGAGSLEPSEPPFKIAFQTFFPIDM